MGHAAQDASRALGRPAAATARAAEWGPGEPRSPRTARSHQRPKGSVEAMAHCTRTKKKNQPRLNKLDYGSVYCENCHDTIVAGD